MSFDKDELQSFPMDIPHVTAIDLPLIVKNTNRAIDALGGKRKIINSINSNDPLELRLRKDPFHHPPQATTTSNERILMKISIPKASLPQDYQSMSVRQLLALNDSNESTPRSKIQPVGIIDKTYSFKQMADLQVCTKNNPTIQRWNSTFKNRNLNLSQIKAEVDQHGSYQNYIDVNDEYFENKDLHLIPPPILSPIKFPFDYKFQRSAITKSIKDDETGEEKLLVTKHETRLFTQLIEYGSPIPLAPSIELIDNLENLLNKEKQLNEHESNLLKCIEWLKEMFELKPIWLRKDLQSVIPDEISRSLKFAFPYVSFMYKTGPWRFCNVKYGLNPISDPNCWQYQSEYFRVVDPRKQTHNHNNSTKPTFPKDNRVVPRTLLGKSEEFKIPKAILFNGESLPTTVTYQIGDIIDTDITTRLQDDQINLGNSFLLDHCTFQDGWINRKTLNVVRSIIRYKLKQWIHELPIDEFQIRVEIDKAEKREDKIDDADRMDIDEVGIEENDAEEMERELQENNDDDDDDEMLEENNQDLSKINEQDIYNKIGKMTKNSQSSTKLSNLVGIIKQSSLERKLNSGK